MMIMALFETNIQYIIDYVRCWIWFCNPSAIHRHAINLRSLRYLVIKQKENLSTRCILSLWFLHTSVTELSPEGNISYLSCRGKNGCSKLLYSRVLMRT